jgi:hypothetical protein
MDFLLTMSAERCLMPPAEFVKFLRGPRGTALPIVFLIICASGIRPRAEYWANHASKWRMRVQVE